MTQAWPFLIGRGRRQGYTVLLAPDFLVKERGFLEAVATPRPVPIQATSPSGKRLSLACAEYRITPADIGGVDPRDEHSRPLELLYGFLCTTEFPAVDPVDMVRARQVALDTYRRFLADEEGFTFEQSVWFAGASVATRAPSSSPRRLGPTVLAGLVVAGLLTVIAVVYGATSTSSPPATDQIPTKTTTTTTTTDLSPAPPKLGC